MAGGLRYRADQVNYKGERGREKRSSSLAKDLFSECLQQVMLGTEAWNSMHVSQGSDSHAGT